jgi:hypothetical protein
VIKLILLIEGGKLNYTNIVDFYWKEDGHPRWNSAVIETLFQWINATSDPATYSPVLLRGVDLLRTPMHATCFENMVKPICSERYFYSATDVQLLQRFTRKHLPHFSPTTDSCPPPKAAVLYRSGLGAGLRKILNYDAISAALKENGIYAYENVTVAQDTPLDESIKIFSSVGLLIASHSSQLKLLAFAHPGTIVIEVRPKESAKWYGHSVFSEGSDTLGVHYYSNSKHAAAPCPSNPDICDQKGNIYSDVWVNKTELSSAIREGLATQRLRCKLNWN